ncbi:HlyD family secretion protein [Escherichia albertii]|uniref:HlyD family secretion protein n=2 Tax=Escherichia albertii TaxID=208962 RepID=UPI0011EBEB80|nr:HlyD family efflux transporter periplasmic adaptor subunit [Escherichia albertii]
MKKTMDIYREIKKDIFGDLYIPENKKIKYLILLFFFIAVAVGGLLTISDYTQRHDALGIIYPDRGAYTISSDRNGIINNIKVTDGSHINKSDILFIVNSSHSSRKYINNEESYAQLLRENYNNIGRNNEEEISAYKKQLSLIDKEIKSENDNLSSLLTEKKLIDMSLNANQALYNKLENAYKNKVVTITDKNNAQSQLMESVLQQSSLQRVIYEKKEKIIDLKIQKSTLEEKLKYSSSSRKEKEINNMINIYNNTEKNEYTQLSPVQGTITSINKQENSQVKEGEYILSIIPDGSKYNAIIFISPEIVGRVKLNRKITLHIDSYPYQRFGVISGKIVHISNIPLNIENIYNKFNVKVDIPSYIAIAEIECNNNIRLIPDMTLKADIPLETRPLFKWLYSSLFKNDTGINF